MKNNVVYVISKDRKPLMPTRRFGKVRHLLETGKAVPINTNPFTIRLKYDTAHYVQDLYAGIDTGRENIGSAVSEESGRCSYLADTRTNNKSVKKNMANRAGFRSERRRLSRTRSFRVKKENSTTVSVQTDGSRRPQDSWYRLPCGRSNKCVRSCQSHSFQSNV